MIIYWVSETILKCMYLSIATCIFLFIYSHTYRPYPSATTPSIPVVEKFNYYSDTILVPFFCAPKGEISPSDRHWKQTLRKIGDT